MNKKHAKNVYKLIKALEESPDPKAFDMSDYINQVSEDDLSYADAEGLHRPLEIISSGWCGTPSCVFGHFASRIDLQKLVLIKEIKNTFNKFLNEYDIVNKNGISIGHEDTEVLEYFGITRDEAEELFGREGCDYAMTTQDAISYIKRFLKDKGYNWQNFAREYE